MKRCWLEFIRPGKKGYAIDEEEYLTGVRCIAASVMNAFGKTVDAIGLTASAATLTQARIRS